MKSGYMNSTMGRNRPSCATPPASPKKPFSLIGVPITRSGPYFFASPLVAPLVPPLRRCTSSPSTMIRSSVSIRRSTVAAIASTNFVSRHAPSYSRGSRATSPPSSLASPRIPVSTTPGSGQRSGRMRRRPSPSGSSSVRFATAAAIAACACSRTATIPSSSISERSRILCATRSSGSRARQSPSSSFVR
jgi:hypothetical protein